MKLGIFPLRGAIQHYKWGGKSFIPDLLGVQNASEEPFAELWMGTHHKGTATVFVIDEWVSLSQLLQKDPNMVGQVVQEKFNGELPYLFKVLDVNQMLSIQAHPTKPVAVEGFKRENAQGIPLTAKNRVYRDDNHKPEIMLALTDFWLLHGFKSEAAIEATLTNIEVFNPLLPSFKEGGIYELYKLVMEMGQEEVDQMLLPLKEEILPGFEAGAYEKHMPEYWAGKAFKEDILGNGRADRGIFSIFLFNLVEIKPGNGIYQGAGIPHAYLEGVNVELMANSDNVFRGGLTYKHIDVPELLKNLDFNPVQPQILSGEKTPEGAIKFPTPAPDFELIKIELGENQTYQATAQSPEIMLVMNGGVELVDEQQFKKGSSFFVPAGHAYSFKGILPKTEVYGARVP